MFWTEFGIIDKERKSCFLIMGCSKGSPGGEKDKGGDSPGHSLRGGG